MMRHHRLRRGIPWAFLSAASLLLFSTFFALPAQAGTIASLVAVPASAAFPTYTFGPSGFSTGIGSAGNGDGASPVISQTPGGLELQTPFSIYPLTFGQQNGPSGSTFYDTTLVLTGLAVGGFATQSTPVPGITFDSQALTNGTFAIYGSKPGGGLGPLLLDGSLTNNAITGVDGSSTAAVFSTQVTYDSNIADPIGYALVHNGGSDIDDASFNLSLSGSSTLSIGGSGYLSPFDAEGQALFNSFNYTVPPPVPEPSSVVLFGIGLLGMGVVAARRRRAIA